MRAKPTRAYRIGPNQYVNIEKEYEMKFGAYLYYVWAGVTKTIPGAPLGRFSRFAEALAFVRELAKEEN